MAETEIVKLTVLCLIHKNDEYLLQNSELANQNIVNDLPELLQVMLTEDLTEFQYVIENGSWNVVIK